MLLSLRDIVTPNRIAPVFLLIVALSFPIGATARAAAPTSPQAACTSSVGPGIPPPTSVPSGMTIYHSSWYGQSGYMTLCPGDTSMATLAIYNSGTGGWHKDGWAAQLGTWSPTPGQDQPTPLGGDGTNGSPATGWPRYNRVAIQPAAWVGPNQVAWFQFQVRAPSTPGSYRLYLRPLVEGAVFGGVSGQWMQDQGIYWQITVVAFTDGRDAPTVGASGEGRSDVRLTITEPSTNANGLTYAIQRTALMTAPMSCGASTGTYTQIATITIPNGSNTASYLDAGRPDGQWCYRVGAADPATGTTAWGYSNPAVIAPPVGP